MKISCPNPECQQHIAILPENCGSVVNCPACSIEFQIPPLASFSPGASKPAPLRRSSMSWVFPLLITLAVAAGGWALWVYVLHARPDGPHVETVVRCEQLSLKSNMAAYMRSQTITPQGDNIIVFARVAGLKSEHSDLVHRDREEFQRQMELENENPEIPTRRPERKNLFFLTVDGQEYNPSFSSFKFPRDGKEGTLELTATIPRDATRMEIHLGDDLTLPAGLGAEIVPFHEIRTY